MTTSIRLTFSLLMLHVLSLGQVTISEQSVFGGDNLDSFQAFVKTTDGYYGLVLTFSPSGTGNLSYNNYGGSDYVLVKYDNNFNIAWQRSFGGSGDDYPSDLLLFNGNLYLCGSSNSPISGNKTAVNYGSQDIWVVKADLNGNKIWDRSYGGTDSENIGRIESFGNDLVIASTSLSSNDGNKTTANNGGSDYWVFNIDTNGDFIWQKSYGSNGMDRISEIKTFNSNIYVLGDSDGGQTGDKSEPSYGSNDIWILKIDGSGNLLWDKTIGGSDNDSGTPDFAFLNDVIFLPINSSSGISGNREIGSKGISDIWITKLNLNGSVIDQFAFGGDDIDQNSSITVLNDKLFLGGNSLSNTSIDKTEDSNGFRDIWLLSFDFYGSLLWQKTIGGSFTDGCGPMVVHNDTLVIAGSSASVISGDKTVPNYGDWDGWILQLDIESLSVDSQEDINISSKLYPVPMEDNLTIEFESYEVPIKEIKLYNSLGKTVFDKSYNDLKNSVDINTSQLEKGSYIIEVITGSGVLRRTIVK